MLQGAYPGQPCGIDSSDIDDLILDLWFSQTGEDQLAIRSLENKEGHGIYVRLERHESEGEWYIKEIPFANGETIEQKQDEILEVVSRMSEIYWKECFAEKFTEHNNQIQGTEGITTPETEAMSSNERSAALLQLSNTDTEIDYK